jgi:hypothetical protein
MATKKTIVKRKITGVKKVAGVKRKRRVGYVPVNKAPAISGVDKAHKDGKKILSDIARLEKQYKKADRDEKKLLAHIINAKHDSLDSITKRLKK